MLMHSKIIVGVRGDPTGRPQNLAGVVGELAICRIIFLELLEKIALHD